MSSPELSLLGPLSHIPKINVPIETHSDSVAINAILLSAADTISRRWCHPLNARIEFYGGFRLNFYIVTGYINILYFVLGVQGCRMYAGCSMTTICNDYIALEDPNLFMKMEDYISTAILGLYACRTQEDKSENPVGCILNLASEVTLGHAAFPGRKEGFDSRSDALKPRATR